MNTNYTQAELEATRDEFARRLVEQIKALDAMMEARKALG